MGTNPPFESATLRALEAASPRSAVDQPAWVRFAFAQIKPAIIAFELGLLILLVRVFSVESKALQWMMVLAFGGFIVHHFLPMALRMPFFSALSVAGVAVILGPVNALWLVGIGLVLLAVAHAPIPFWFRVGVIVVLGLVLTAFRAEWMKAPFSPAVWPILGSMFMFRMMVYLYDLYHRSAPFGFWRAISYFFMLPNVCFPLFPVVDYKTFCRTYYNGDSDRIYQTGIAWMFRGVVQLILYRFVYQTLLVDLATVTDALGAARYAVATYLLYLKVSGSFHLIVGLLHLFGFNLSETNHLYLLSSSFTDFWRRINIYWKDFILKLFFNPMFFRLKRSLSHTTAMVTATMLAFAVTWLLHSYQWFWIRGDFPVIWQDVVFWGILAVGVAVTAVFETKVARQRTLGKARPSLMMQIRKAAWTVVMFTALVILWSMWSAGSLEEWLSFVSQFSHSDLNSVLLLIGVLILLGAASMFVGHTTREVSDGRSKNRNGASGNEFWRPTMRVGILSLLLLWVGYNPLVLSFAPQVAEAMDHLKNPEHLNQRDAKMLERGYYEDLTNAARFNVELAELYTERPMDWNAGHAVRHTGGFPPYELIPSQQVEYKGVIQSTNRWGMRDRDYEMTKPPATFRIALLGDSHSKGSGVQDNETFENVVEDRLNSEFSRGNNPPFEILNFSVGGYGPLCRLATLEQKVLDFNPDVVIYEGIDDPTWIINELANAVDRRIELPYEEMRERVRRAGVTPETPRIVAEQRLKPHADELLEWAYGRFAARCREKGVIGFAIFLPRPEKLKGEAELIARQTALAKKAGLGILDLSQSYAGVKDFNTLWLAKWDRHPNAEGHRRVAESFYKEVRQHILADLDNKESPSPTKTP
ncbi:MAG: SGNH/GDSL hydrolase family protein [Planctomycetota bacterium]